MMADGGHDWHKQLALSGEPLVPQLADMTLREPTDVVAYQAATVEGRAYEAAYSDYWNASGADDGTSGYFRPHST